MDIFQPDLENAIAKYLHTRTGKEWQVEAERKYMNLEFVCTCEDWRGSTRSIDIGRIENGIRMYVDELLAYWHMNNSQESNERN